jgi:hypothetical protein
MLDFFSLKGRHFWFALLSLTVLSIVHSGRAQTYSDVFFVKSGSTKGGCDGFSTQLTQYFDEVKELVNAAITVLSDLEEAGSINQRTVTGYFGLNFKKTVDTSYILGERLLRPVQADLPGLGRMVNERASDDRATQMSLTASKSA